MLLGQDEYQYRNNVNSRAAAPRIPNGSATLVNNVNNVSSNNSDYSNNKTATDSSTVDLDLVPYHNVNGLGGLANDDLNSYIRGCHPQQLSSSVSIGASGNLVVKKKAKKKTNSPVVPFSVTSATSATSSLKNNLHHHHHHNHNCACDCHVSASKSDEAALAAVYSDNHSTNPLTDIMTSNIRLSRIAKQKLSALLIGLLCFTLGLALPFILQYSHETSLAKQQADHVKYHRPPRPLPSKALHNHFSDTMLDSVFISVKTTKQYHYPRLVIQLETWVSLVRHQVRPTTIK